MSKTIYVLIAVLIIAACSYATAENEEKEISNENVVKVKPEPLDSIKNVEQVKENTQSYIKEIYPEGYNYDSALREFFEVHMMNFINKNKKYPLEAKEAKIEACVPVIYQINIEEGKIYYIDIADRIIGGKGKEYKPVGYGLEEEATRVFKLMESWDEYKVLMQHIKYDEWMGTMNVCFP